mmetsp:Transcript_23784/g.50922  ORF Transcript_23784/g.50922 Transcript_23784/m.50922 type:complete len:148 (-) Transcript_23784:160-603(-)|eukprot:CAMPEP_0172557704 /NCGR_PEP_ID=MMETSP1067-20121228/74747_1 /TAXON_ID=265564 ORGANISM="Thalassiosira punctigera, Strain Tpunct2005C2" /NCGR_SAMPLE_ID=MMETSP1067 /ASSEMBLY_ACC=CAM_ASM_000444 /LENGTH=147 /DNA_ID=CAMNT_0013346857 /DNA_START=65 /DNA_END=508 /DNA_ORIENTATION=-
MGLFRLRTRSAFQSPPVLVLQESPCSNRGILEGTDDDDSVRSNDNCCRALSYQDVLDLFQRRLLSSSSSNASSSSSASRVSFVDEELGLPSRRVVTQTYYRPRTTEEEKRELYYNQNDIRSFQRIEREIRANRRLAAWQEAFGQIGE